jgi:hypothetical protein
MGVTRRQGDVRTVLRDGEVFGSPAQPWKALAPIDASGPQAPNTSRR